MKPTSNTYFELAARVLLTLTLMVYAGCSTQPKADAALIQSSHVQSLSGAAEFIDGLRKSDQLPGMHKDGHGFLITIPETFTEGETSYPASATFLGRITDNDSLFFYTVTKSNSASPWQLTRATRQDKTGHVIEDLLSK